jgi:hypothetical protein
LLAGVPLDEIESVAPSSVPSSQPAAPTHAERIAALEELTEKLGAEVTDLKAQLARFRSQFE